MNNDTAVLTLLIELQNDRQALRDRVAALEAALAERGPAQAGTLSDPLPTPPMTPTLVQNC